MFISLEYGAVKKVNNTYFSEEFSDSILRALNFLREESLFLDCRDYEEQKLHVSPKCRF